MAGIFLSRPRRLAVLGAGLMLAGSSVVAVTATGAASAAPSQRLVTVTFDNRSGQLIAACIFGSGGRCTNGGIAAGAKADVIDPFNSREKVQITVFQTGTGTPDQVTRTVAAGKQLCATVTGGRSGPLKLSVKSGTC